MLFMLIAHVIETENNEPTPIAILAAHLLGQTFDKMGITDLKEREACIAVIRTAYRAKFGTPTTKPSGFNTTPSTN